VFKLDPSGTETVLYSFKGSPDGDYPLAGLIMDTAGTLYGTTGAGGILGQNCSDLPPVGCGTVFMLDPFGNESIYYSFKGGPDGAFPSADLIMDAAGNLYGTASLGGVTSQSCFSVGCGTVFKLAAVTFTDLINLVQQSVTDLRAQNLLVTESKMAEDAFEKGNQKAVNRMLNTFIHQVSAVHSKKSLTSAQAATLIQEAKDLMT
jgi:hypothetical protein